MINIICLLLHINHPPYCVEGSMVTFDIWIDISKLKLLRKTKYEVEKKTAQNSFDNFDM